MGGGIFLEEDFGGAFADDFGGAFFAFAAGFLVAAILLGLLFHLLREHHVVLHVLLHARLGRGFLLQALHTLFCHFFPLFSTLVDYTLLQTADALTDPEV